MVQRKQSLWLLIASLLNAGILLTYLYRMHTVVNGADNVVYITANNDYPSWLLVLFMSFLPLATIFMYKNRKRQIWMTILSVIAVCGFIFLTLSRVSKETSITPPPTNGTYWIGSILPVISLVFLILAIMGIRKDEKLVKSVDRLR